MSDERAICGNCRWWDNSCQSGVIEGESGMCRATLPTIDERDGTARWPFTEDVDWCACFAYPPRQQQEPSDG